MYTSTTTHQSKTIPGASFVVRTLSEGRRIKISQALADVYGTIDDLRTQSSVYRRKLAPLLEELKTLKVLETDDEAVKDDKEAKTRALLDSNDDFAVVAAIQRKIDTLESDEVLPVYVRTLLKSVDGEGIPADPAEFIEDGPSNLYNEIAQVVKREMGLSDAESGNSVPPSISTAPEGGATTITTAETVNSAATAA